MKIREPLPHNVTACKGAFNLTKGQVTGNREVAGDREEGRQFDAQRVEKTVAYLSDDERVLFKVNLDHSTDLR